MTKKDKAGFKNLLKNEITGRLKKDRKYFSRRELCDIIPASILPDTLNRYMVDFNKEDILYGAGRGWYSFIKQPFELELKPVKRIVTTLEKKYPILSFCVWSTEQLKSFVHHTLARFVIFVYVNRDNMSGIYDFLKDSGYDVWLNPRGNEAHRFTISEKAVVIRPAISREHSSKHFADIEKILVDLFVEAASLNLMDEDEYYRIFKNVLEVGRVDIGALINYAGRRKLETKQLIEELKSV